mgnify:CR=1 FL=1
MFNLIEIIAILSFSLMHFIEVHSFSSRAAGKLSGNTALGTTFHYSMDTASRFLLIIFLPALSFLVESKSSVNSYLLVVIWSLFLCFMGNLYIVLRLNSAQFFFQNVFNQYAKTNFLFLSLFQVFFYKTNRKKDLKQLEGFKFNKITYRKTLVAFLSYTFLNTGFFVAFLMSFIFYDYRLTVSQFSTMFHGFGAIVVAFYLDPMLSRSIDESLSKGKWLSDMYSILFGRMLSYFIALFFFLAYYFFNT